MKIITCVDKNLGVSFNNRRQSRDRLIIKDIVENFGKVFTFEYSLPLFSEYSDFAVLTQDTAKVDGYLFIEKSTLSEFENKISTLVLYRFDKVYPSDRKLEISLENFKLKEKIEFQGNSHEKIIKEIYVK